MAAGFRHQHHQAAIVKESDYSTVVTDHDSSMIGPVDDIL